jgi:protein TonB
MSNNQTKSEELERFDNLDEIVFHDRNKEYGAYWLRKRYKRFVVVAFFFSFVIIAAVVAVPIINAYRMKGNMKKLMEKNVVAEVSSVKEDAPPPPPPPPPPPDAAVAQVKFVAPVVVDTVKNEVDFASIDDVKAIATNEAVPENITVAEAPKKEKAVVEEEPVFVVVEESATFQGGDVMGYRTWVQQHLVYPADAQEAGISGKVIVQFAVNSHGQVCDAKVVRGVHPSLDKEVINCIMKSPSWTPAKQGGKAVKQQFTIPIVFNLQ